MQEIARTPARTRAERARTERTRVEDARAERARVERARNGHAATFAPRFGVPFFIFCALSALLVGCWPLQLSVATVFLFAGPHNWMEFRFFLARMPARWGRSKPFFAAALGGVAALTAGYVTLYALGQTWYLSEAAWTAGAALWTTALLIWLCTLVHLRARQMRRDRSWVFAVGFALCAGAWLAPAWFGLALVYLHPLVALWFLNRQLKRTRPRWRATYHLCLAALPVLLALMWTQLAHAPNVNDEGTLAWRITQHAGAGLLTGVSSRLLVSTHVFLETIHYGAWLVLIPLVGLGSKPWRVERIPLAAARDGWPRTVRAALIFSALVALALWVSFAADYATTRDLYFTFAMAHVLAEAPFLIRLL
ncbi:MAG TPA: hypothetical protein VE713_04540 [Pyrinomonadaceae bacterium]|nr:hypothetical protein [Pyrinomonadaceae bacterium]